MLFCLSLMSHGKIHFQQEYGRTDVLSELCTRRHLMLIGLLTGDVNFNYLIKMVFVKVFFLLSFINIFGGNTHCCCCLVTKSCPTLLQPCGLQPTRLLSPWDFPDKNFGVGFHFLLSHYINSGQSNLTHQFQYLLPYINYDDDDNSC